MSGRRRLSLAARRVRGGIAFGLLACALVLLPGARSAAQTTASDPTFFIETISVEEAERFATIIVAESLLEEGREYSERQLREAIYRIIRLPLVLDAEFSLRKGSERGRYELVITAEEAKRWFLGLDARTKIWSRPISVAGLTTSSTSETSTAVIGRRFAIGRYGVAFVALGGVDGSINFGYNRHNLLDRGILLSLSYAYAGCNDDHVEPNQEGDEGCRTEIFGLGLDPTLSTWSNIGASHRFRASIAVPVRDNLSLRFATSLRRTEGGLRRSAFDFDGARFDSFRDREELELSASWAFDAIDDPQFPTTGRRWDAGLTFRSVTADLVALDLAAPGSAAAFEMQSREYGLRGEASRYYPLTEQTSLWGRVDAFLGRSKFDDVPIADLQSINGSASVWRGGLAFGHGRFLRRIRNPHKWREWRWENEVELSHSGTSPEFDQPYDPISGFRIASSIAFRNRLGLFRLELAYVDLEGR